ncbi:cilia- and flagella-associated protein 54, partial [Centroberyx affinis]|uniref:cilia- and flagella-associated protein 54 n=1 Tax=Centroberyx affinis TaxID=166261 RepID=UPI003A5C07E7
TRSTAHNISPVSPVLQALRVLREHRMASEVMSRGHRLLQEVHEAQLQLSRLANEAEGTSQPHELTGQEDPIILYNVITTNTLKCAYRDVMKFRRKACFIEFAALLLQRTMEENQPDLVIQWGENIFEFLSRRDEGLGQSIKYLDGKAQSKRRRNGKGNDTPKNKKTSSPKDKRKKAQQKKQHSMLQGEKTDREMQAVENLLALMSSLMRCHQQRLQLRHMCCEESVWRSHLNHSMAQAHMALLHKGLDQLHGATLQHSYSQLNPLSFSLAHSGVLVRWKNSSSPEHEVASRSHRNSPLCDLRDYLLPARKDKEKEEAVSGEDKTEEDSSQTAAQQATSMSSPSRFTAALLLDSLSKAALHFRRAMVLAHRGGHWTTLQCVCQTLWDQGCRVAVLVQRAAQLDPPSPLTVDQLHTSLTPLLVLATDLLMDMLNRLGLWSVYDSDVSDEELEASLHFSPPLDDSSQVDLRWVRTLVLYTLELLHDRAKWETLAHFALLFNSYTRERYSLIVTPLLVHAQRKLLDRISSLGGPPVPQPHHVKTQKATGKEITCRSYASCQLFSGWTRPPKDSPAQQTPTRNNPPLTNPTHPDTVELQEMRRSMCLVCVPLDVEGTLCCYRQALERRTYCLQTFQHSRSLLLLLLAHTQPLYCVCLSPAFVARFRSSGQLDFSPMIMSIPDLQPQDLTEEDYSTLKALYSLPISPNHINTVITAYSTSIKYLQANSHDSLRVQALHDMGNLQFYNGNTRAAHSCWCKAVDCALQSSGVLEKWDGVSWGGGSPQHTLKLAGIWGCLQAAVLTTKIAQYILTSDIGQRTKCCLLSAHLFKCVLCCSLPQPQCDLQYASHSLGDELLPGVNLFSEAHRVHLGSAVTSLNFLCYWLYTTGHYITLLPMLALYLHFAGTVCRDVQRTVEAKILKIRALTELSLFAQAIKEAVQLTQGKGVPLSHGHNISIDNPQPVRKFHSHKSLLDNAQALEDLVNCDLAPEVRMLYGSTLCHRCSLARVQLVLALSSTVQSLPLKVNSVHHEQDRPDTEGTYLKRKESKVLALDSQKEKLTPGKIKFLLLEGAFHLLMSSSQQLLPRSHSKIEDLELTIEANLLMANLYLQQGRAARSSDMAVSSLLLLQTTAVIMGGSPSSSQKPASLLPHARAASEQGSGDPHGVSGPLPGDCPRAVEASERTGAALWLRCRLTLVRSLAAHIPGTAIFPGLDSNEEAARVLKEGLEECALWGDPDTRALLLLEGATLEAQRGQPKDVRISLLQEAVSLLSGRTCMPPGSSVTLARATLLLSDLRGTHSTTLLELTQKLLQQQLYVFGQKVVLEDGKVCFPPPGPSNIYLPHLTLLAKTTMRIGHILAVKAMERPVSAQSTESTPRRRSLQSSNQTERDAQAPSPSLSHLNTSSPTNPSMFSPFQIPGVSPGPDVVQAWHDAHKVLQSALTLAQSCAYRDTQLEVDLLYCCGGMLRNCYLEIALLFLHDWQHTPHKPPAPLSQNKISHWKRLLASLNRRLTATEGHLLLFWICLRGAAMVLKAMSGCGQLCGSIGGEGDALSEKTLKSLPDFATNDLLNPCGGVYSANPSLEEEQSFRAVDRKHSQLTWVHMARYYTHLLNLQQTANDPVCPQTVEGLASLSGDISAALRLSQLHNFFCSHMTDYRESCCAPEPAPAEIILLPQIVQLSPTLQASLGREDELYQWSISTKQQLCLQWHRPALSPVPGYQDIVFLLYGHNRHPMSATRGSTIAVKGLRCGQHMIRIERAKAVHAELCEMCVSANMTLSVAANFGCTSSPKAQQVNKREPINQHMARLKEKILSCCLSIKDLLQPDSKSDPLTKVPFEITVENLCDLERCFNPAGGAIVDGSALTDWILSILTNFSPHIDQKT